MSDRKLVLRESALNDWYVIEWDDGSDVTSAQVEGSASEMTAIAANVLAGTGIAFKRCACKVDGDSVLMWSPRNSIDPGSVPLDVARAWAEETLAKLMPGARTDAVVRLGSEQAAVPLSPRPAWTPEREAEVRRMCTPTGASWLRMGIRDALAELDRVRAIAVGLLDDCERYERQWTSTPRVLAKDWACPECATPNDRLDTDIQVDPTFQCHKHAARALRRTL